MVRTTRRSRQAGQHTGLGEQTKREQEFLRSGAVSTTTNDTQQDSRFFSLPAEIRNRIYELVLGGRTIHCLSTTRGHKSGRLVLCEDEVGDEEAAREIRSAKTAIETAPFRTRHATCTLFFANRHQDIARQLTLDLLLTCRQVHSEAAAIPFQSNTFVFKWPSDISQFLEWLNPVQVASIATVVTTDHKPAPGGLPVQSFPCQAPLCRLAGLRALTIFAPARPDWIQAVKSNLDGIRTRSFEQAAQFAKRLPNQSIESVQFCMYREDVTEAPRRMVQGQTDPEAVGSFCDEMERIIKGA